MDTATGEKVLLSLVGGVVQGRTATTDALVFAVSVSVAGVVTLDQQRAVVHPDATNPDDSTSLMAADLVTLSATVTDQDGDSDTASLDLGNNLVFKDDGPMLSFGNLIGTGTISPQFGEWSGVVGADQPGNLDIALEGFSLVRPDGTTVSGSSFQFAEAALSPDQGSAYRFAGSLTGDFDNNAGTADTTVNFTLAAFADGRYQFDLEEGFGSTVTISSADGQLPAGGPDPVQTLKIGETDIVFFAVNPLTATDASNPIVPAIGLGEPDLSEAQLEAKSAIPGGDGTFPFISSSYLMNVSTSGIGVGNNVLQGNTTSGINTGDESFVVNPEDLLSKVKVYIDNSVGGYNTATEQLFYKAYYADGTTSASTLVTAAMLSPAPGGQVSFNIESEGGKLIDAVQLTMGRGDIKIPVIEFTKESANLANDVQLEFSALLKDGDYDAAASNFFVNLFSNEVAGSYDYQLAGIANKQDAFNIDLASAFDSYEVSYFDLPADKLVLVGDTGASFLIDHNGADSLVTVTETGGAVTTVLVVGVDLQATSVVLA